MSYYLAPSLAQLRAEVDARWPDRDKTSDGWIGDPSHQARKSDHNPDWSDGGVVRALDIDVTGIDVDELLAAVVGDPRVAYVIHERKIEGTDPDTEWEAYGGSNPHTTHVHISIWHTRKAETDTRPWIGKDVLDMDEQQLRKIIGEEIHRANWGTLWRTEQLVRELVRRGPGKSPRRVLRDARKRRAAASRKDG